MAVHRCSAKRIVMETRLNKAADKGAGILNKNGAGEGAVAPKSGAVSLEAQLAARTAELERLKAQRFKDLDRLAAVTRTRDLLEKRSAVQSAKIASLTKRQEADEEKFKEAMAQTPALATTLGEPDGKELSWSERRWWDATIKVAQKSHRAGQHDDARAAFELALRTKQTASLWEQLGHVLREDSRYGDAELAYQRSLRMRPGSAELLFLTGYCSEMSGHKEEAINRYELALAAEPGLASRYAHLRDFHARLAN